jgi:hypothetical protein
MMLTTASLALLAACGGGPSDNSSANGAAPANGATAAPAAPTDPELASMRAGGVAVCSDETARRSPPGTDVARLCGCAIDRVMAGKTLAQAREIRGDSEQVALNACAREQAVTLTARRYLAQDF